MINLVKKGFTLSEVLITLGIIGVIAALTIPSLVKNYRYKMYSTQFKKVYSQIQTATKTVMTDEIANDFYQTTAGVQGDSDCTKGPCYFLTKYFKTTRTDCKNTTPQCVATSYKSNSGEDAGELGGDYCIQTINSATICITNDSEKVLSTIFVDTNGETDPNIVGIDAFVMKLNSDGRLEDLSDDTDDCNKKVSESGNISDYATGCLTKVINNNWEIKD